MRLFLLIFTVLIATSCSTPKETVVKVPRLKHEKKGTKREIRKYTKEFVNRLYDSTVTQK